MLLGLAICLAIGVKAQFYDGPDDIYYYVEYKNGECVNDGYARVFNFDGNKGCLLNMYMKDGAGPYTAPVRIVKANIKENPTYYEDLVETSEYTVKYSHGSTYTHSYDFIDGYSHKTKSLKYNYKFSSDRNFLYVSSNDYTGEIIYKKVDKSFFKVGRSRTPSNKLHE